MIDAGYGADHYWEHPPNLNRLRAREILDLPLRAFLPYMTVSRAFRETIYGVSAARAMDLPRPFGNRRVLDFGCGVGYDAVSLAELGWRVSLFDLHDANRRVAARWLRQLEFYAEEALDIQEGAYSLVHSYGVLHHIKLVEPVIRQLQRAVAPGGALLLMLYTDTFVPEVDQRSDGKLEGPYTRGYSLEQAQELLGPGWEIWRTEVWNQNKYRAISASRVGERPLKRDC